MERQIDASDLTENKLFSCTDPAVVEALKVVNRGCAGLILWPREWALIRGRSRAFSRVWALIQGDT